MRSLAVLAVALLLLAALAAAVPERGERSRQYVQRYFAMHKNKLKVRRGSPQPRAPRRGIASPLWRRGNDACRVWTRSARRQRSLGHQAAHAVCTRPSAHAQRL